MHPARAVFGAQAVLGAMVVIQMFAAHGLCKHMDFVWAYEPLHGDVPEVVMPVEDLDTG